MRDASKLPVTANATKAGHKFTLRVPPERTARRGTPPTRLLTGWSDTDRSAHPTAECFITSMLSACARKWPLLSAAGIDLQGVRHALAPPKYDSLCFGISNVATIQKSVTDTDPGGLTHCEVTYESFKPQTTFHVRYASKIRKGMADLTPGTQEMGAYFSH